ncbi:2-keto-4-pentenoate hydratase [Nocardioides sp. L-11A]|uniref:2-keto-4-pentenoate hydratase n=1 Tax=Nocardioides sp. L-11A TaxID=3043848 RepID=UPI00249C0717|nr:hypothetical protein QJ852_26845 [Nocardioides sp. L-11A]
MTAGDPCAESDAVLAASLEHNYTVYQCGPGGSALGAAPAPVPTGDRRPPPAAYALSAEIVARVQHTWATTPRGFKLSMTNEADQARFATTEPSYGVLTSAHVPGDPVVIALAHANAPLVESELVARATRELGPELTGAELQAGIEVAAGLEIPVSRIPGWWPDGGAPAVTLSDFILDNAMAGYLAHGERWLPAADLDLAALTVEVVDPDGTVHPGAATHVLGDPLRALQWLVGALARRGEVVPAGAIISTGTFLRPLRARTGTFRATFSHGLGDAVVTFR